MQVISDCDKMMEQYTRQFEMVLECFKSCNDSHDN